MTELKGTDTIQHFPPPTLEQLIHPALCIHLSKLIRYERFYLSYLSLSKLVAHLVTYTR